MGNRFLQEFIGSREVEAPPLPSIDGFSKAQFWDGRTSTLEDQSVGPLTNPIEHGFANNDAVVSTIKKIAGYKNFFQDTFGTNSITIQQVGKAIASFQRTLISGNSPFDRFDWDGEEKAISKAAKRGKKLFFGKARCNLCHFGTNFSDENFHNIGIGWGGEAFDVRRYYVSHDKKDIGAFKTPPLREVSRTTPYMHDGRFVTLKQVVDHHNQGSVKNQFLDNQVIPLNLSESEKQDLVEMLRSLNGEGWKHAKTPLSFPE
jgi:cytochrome c peroxidase